MGTREIDEQHPYAWMGRRTRDVHDIWHILSGYHRDALGEASLVAFSFAQTGGLGWALIALGAAFKARGAREYPFIKSIWQGYRRGKGRGLAAGRGLRAPDVGAAGRRAPAAEHHPGHGLQFDPGAGAQRHAAQRRLVVAPLLVQRAARPLASSFETVFSALVRPNVVRFSAAFAWASALARALRALLRLIGSVIGKPQHAFLVTQAQPTAGDETMIQASEIREHMEVLGSDGGHVGKVDT